MQQVPRVGGLYGRTSGLPPCSPSSSRPLLAWGGSLAQPSTGPPRRGKPGNQGPQSLTVPDVGRRALVLVSAGLTTCLCALGACVTLRESVCYTVLVSKDFLKPHVKKLILVIAF